MEQLPADGGEGEEGALEEGGDGDGLEWREDHDVPETADARKRHFLTNGKTEEWVWEEGRVYKADFFNPYIDFNNFSLKLPGFSLSVLPYLGGEDYLRYVLKNKETDEILFVVVFTLLHKEDVEKEEDSSEIAEKSDGDKNKPEHEADKKVAEPQTEQPDGKKEGGRHEGEEDFEPQADDLD
ncbi:hypothetical protein N7G274_007175 [Stereocaulon virgatum]|uniref:Domain of unknown function at the cortex 1 domain-containing protein n=1 Tax=Stereocaulon virgatum TaxID=373712 RepID=A0ABR4A2V5_9LECA